MEVLKSWISVFSAKVTDRFHINEFQFQVLLIRAEILFAGRKNVRMLNPTGFGFLFYRYWCRNNTLERKQYCVGFAQFMPWKLWIFFSNASENRWNRRFRNAFKRENTVVSFWCWKRTYGYHMITRLPIWTRKYSRLKLALTEYHLSSAIRTLPSQK